MEVTSWTVLCVFVGVLPYVPQGYTQIKDTEELETLKASGCYGDTLEILCRLGERINIVTDFYGLTSGGACAYEAGDACVSPSVRHTSTVRRVCNGRTRCIFTVAEKKPCNNERLETNYHQISYHCVPELSIQEICEENTRKETRGYLASPNYPMVYPKDSQCTCVLQSTSGGQVRVRTEDFLLHAASPCRDYVEVSGLEEGVERLCGTQHRVYTATRLTLTFHSQKKAFKGFLIQYEALEGGDSVAVQCRQGPPQDTASTSADDFRFEEDQFQTDKNDFRFEADDFRQEAADFLPRVDVVRDSATIIETSGTRITPPIHQGAPLADDGGRSRWGSVTVLETARARPRPPTRVLAASAPASVASPTRRVVSGCFGDIVHFHCRPGELIRIVEDLYGVGMEAGEGAGEGVGDGCSHTPGDCVIRAVGHRSLVTQLCNRQPACRNLIVTRMFCDDHVTSYQQITYECVSVPSIVDVCSPSVFTSTSGYLASPNFPLRYPWNLNCTCSLRALRGHVALNIAHFALHDHDPCADWLELRMSNETSGMRLCGSQNGGFQGRFIQLHFHSDARYTQTGFWLHYQGSNTSQVVVVCNAPQPAIITARSRPTLSTRDTPSTSTSSSTATPTESTTTTALPTPTPTPTPTPATDSQSNPSDGLKVSAEWLMPDVIHPAGNNTQQYARPLPATNSSHSHTWAEVTPHREETVAVHRGNGFHTDPATAQLPDSDPENTTYGSFEAKDTVMDGMHSSIEGQQLEIDIMQPGEVEKDKQAGESRTSTVSAPLPTIPDNHVAVIGGDLPPIWPPLPPPVETPFPPPLGGPMLPNQVDPASLAGMRKEPAYKKRPRPRQTLDGDVTSANHVPRPTANKHLVKTAGSDGVQRLTLIHILCIVTLTAIMC